LPNETFGKKVNAACGREAALGYDETLSTLQNHNSLFNAIALPVGLNRNGSCELQIGKQ